MKWLPYVNSCIERLYLFNEFPMPFSNLLDTSLTIALLASTLNLDVRTDLSSVLVVAYFFHFIIIDFTVLLKSLKVLLIFFDNHIQLSFLNNLHLKASQPENTTERPPNGQRHLLCNIYTGGLEIIKNKKSVRNFKQNDQN